ncbi:hypothetical protein MMC28_000571 [Mycoblastus sanguinarius]|nr:hypothetical protein [Mycoblastus sanguinarius]
MPSLFAELFDIRDAEPSVTQLRCATRGKNLGILDVILHGLDLDATDPRDKIFALLTFGEETSDVGNLTAEIRPDYTKSIARVFADFTRWWIATHRSLRILSAVHVSLGRTWQRLSQQSAFVEDLDHASWSLWHDGKNFWTRGTLALSPTVPYSASGDTFPDTSLLLQTRNPLELLLRGYEVGVIELIRPYPFYLKTAHVRSCGNPEGCQYNALHEAFVGLFDPLDSRGTWTSGIQQDRLKAFHRPDTAEETSEKSIDHFLTHNEYSSKTGAIGCHESCFFRTPDGADGLCPPAAREKDIIVVLHGGSVPYILRPSREEARSGDTSGAQYYFIGECYLQGYMHGRIIKEHQKENQSLSTRIFELV